MAHGSMIENKVILPITRIPSDVFQTYWQTLYMEDTLKFRLCNVEDPTFSDVLQMAKQLKNGMYMVIDTETKEAVAEFMFDLYTGRSAQIHFSMHPSNNFKESVAMASWATDAILNEWKHPDDGKPYLESIFGLTPTTNRAACIFVQRCGFKKEAVLPGGILDRGNIVDALLTIKPREVQ